LTTEQKMWGAEDDPDKPWAAPDGTRWLYFPVFGEWNGWVPSTVGSPPEGDPFNSLMTRTIEEFRRSYPDAPCWDNWTKRRVKRA
jgi:hypothetical protein